MERIQTRAHGPRTVRSKERLAVCGTIALCALLMVSAGCETSNPELRHRGNSAYLSGNYERSLEFYAQAVRQKPTDVDAQYGLARAHLALDQPRDAQLAFEEALSLAGDDPNLTPLILDGLAEALYQLDRHERLYTVLRESTRRYGTMRDYLRQGDFLVRMGDMDGAEAAYQRAAHFAPDGRVEPWLALVDFYENRNNIPKAEQYLRYAAFVAPNDPDVADRAREYGYVPGPTFAEEPPRALLRPRE